MSRPSRTYLVGGLILGLALAMVVFAYFHLAGYRLMAPAGPAAKGEKKIICWVSPTDPKFIRQEPGKDPQGKDLVPMYGEPGASPPGAVSGKERKIKYWVSSMDPTFVRKTPGKDTMGMDLVPVYEAPEEVAPKEAAAQKGRKVKFYVDPMNPQNIASRPGKAPCGMDMVPVYEDDAAAAAEGAIAVNPNTLQSMGVRTAPVEVRKLSRTIRAVGRVTYDERRLTQVNTKVDGWVESLFVNVTGDPIRKGQPLLSIYSPELVSGQREYLLSLKNLKSLQKSSFPDLAATSRKLMEASRRRLEYWDISAAQINELEKTGQVRKTLTLTSPVNGVVTKRLVTRGQFVQVGAPLLEVADLSEIWVEADIYEYELPWIKVGQHAAMTLTYLPGEVYHGRLEYLYPYLSGTTRTARVRLKFPNPGFKLKPEMYAQVEISSPLPQPVVAVPSEAVLDSGERQLVFVALGQGRFEPRPVKLGVEAGDGWYQVLSGLKGGEEVVTSAQFLLDSESRIREAVSRMLQTQGQEAGAGKPPGKAMEGTVTPMTPPEKKAAPAAPPHKH